MLWLAGAVVVLLLALVVAAPWLVRSTVPEVFARFGLEASATGGRFNPLRAEITVEGFTLGTPSEPALSLDELGVGVGLKALVTGRVEVKRLRVKGVVVDANRLINLWKRVGSASKSGSGGLPFELDDVALEDVRLVSIGERIGHDVRVAYLGITNPSALLASGASRVALRGTVAEGSVDLDLEMTLDGGKLEGVGTYHIDGVPLQGWADLGGGGDPLSTGTVSGRGNVHVAFESTDDGLDLTLDGPVRVDGLGLAVAPVDAERGDASWKGRLALAWTPAMPAPRIRGDGTLQVESVHLTAAAAGRAPLETDLEDVSWQGNFDWNAGLAMDGGVVGTRVDVRDGAGSVPGWQTHAEDFNWRMRTEPQGGASKLELIIQDLNLSRLDVNGGSGDAAVGVAVAKIAVDELRTTRSGGLVLGVASADSVAVTVPSEAGGGPEKIEVVALTARGMSGNADGALHAAVVKAESVDYAGGHGQRSVRVEGVDLASLGLGTTGLMGADQVRAQSAHVEAPSMDVWVSGVKVERVHGDGGGRFGAGRIAVARMFQSVTDGISWQISNLAVDGIDGDIHDATRIAAIELPAASLGIDNASWNASGLHVAGLAVTSSGELNAGRFDLGSLERRELSTGDLRVSKLEGKRLVVDKARAAVDAVTSAAIKYRSPDGLELATEGIAAQRIAGRSSGVTVERLSVARGSGHAIDGRRFAGADLAGRGLAIGVDGGIAVDAAELAKLSGALTESASLEVDGVRLVSLERTRDGALSVREAGVHDARFAKRDEDAWALVQLAAHGLAWRAESGLGIDDATLESVAHTRGEQRQLLGRTLQVKHLAFVSPSEASLASFTAGSVEGSAGASAWTADSLDVEGFEKHRNAGEKVQRLGIAKVEVSDSANGARLSLENARARTFAVSELEELTAARLSVDAVRMASEKHDWPSQLSLSGLRAEKLTLRPGIAIDVHEVVARNPYLVVAQAADNAWMWPPLPGGGGSAKGASDHGIDVRIGQFSTRGPGRIVYIDRATQPAFELALDPAVVALENLDTRLAGSKARFRVRATGEQLADIRVSGSLTRRVESFDVAVELHATGVYVPEFDPYVTRREPVNVAAGWSDIDGNITVDNHQLGGNVGVLMSGLELHFTDEVPLPERVNPEDFPLRTALALLKDPQGNIHIDVPLQARTARKGFDFIDTFQAAFANTLMTAGKVAGNLPEKSLNRALKFIEKSLSLLPGVEATSYSPITFPPGTTAITAPSRVYMGQLAERMHAHPELALALCGRGVPRDREALKADEKVTSIDELFAEAGKGTYDAFGADRTGLIALAGARAGTVRRHLRDLHDIDNRRLAECEAVVETSGGAEPRVDLEVKTPAHSTGLFDFL